MVSTCRLGYGREDKAGCAQECWVRQCGVGYSMKGRVDGWVCTGEVQQCSKGYM